METNNQEVQTQTLSKKELKKKEKADKKALLTPEQIASRKRFVIRSMIVFAVVATLMITITIIVAYFGN